MVTVKVMATRIVEITAMTCLQGMRCGRDLPGYRYLAVTRLPACLSASLVRPPACSTRPKAHNRSSACLASHLRSLIAMLSMRILYDLRPFDYVFFSSPPPGSIFKWLLLLQHVTAFFRISFSLSVVQSPSIREPF
ncbi:hypothetical protein E2C01_038451 [Portunus trituberculatus]|uniref:Uncharacterized protein n=1 Tax=Portunus trituberculatus TaxID=210409 RepID=A0A5B7FE72_PORTR|nr:hypothetical protein [Portunus trituberculatus]